MVRSGLTTVKNPPMITNTLRKYLFPIVILLALFATVPAALGADAEPPLDSGDTAWMLTATVLVLLMTLPGLALFYGGLVRSKNLLSVLMHCFAVAALPLSSG